MECFIVVFNKLNRDKNVPNIRLDAYDFVIFVVDEYVFL